jgi:hypothetical protein
MRNGKFLAVNNPSESLRFDPPTSFVGSPGTVRHDVTEQDGVMVAD